MLLAKGAMPQQLAAPADTRWKPGYGDYMSSSKKSSLIYFLTLLSRDCGGVAEAARDTSGRVENIFRKSL